MDPINDDDKYVVFDREKFAVWLANAGSGIDLTGLREIPDAVVIRRQDVFAAPTLFAYANSIRTATEIMEMCRAEVGADRSQLDPVADRLNSIADYFVTQAERAAKSASKVPD